MVWRKKERRGIITVKIENSGSKVVNKTQRALKIRTARRKNGGGKRELDGRKKRG